MKRNINFRHLFATIISAMIFILPTSCKLIGLGDAIDLTAPEVNITSPESMESIGADFVINGTASDDTKVTSLTVYIKESAQSFKYEGGWQKLDTSSNTWQSISNGTWVEAETSVTWSLPVSINSVTGVTDYTITATAVDAANNNSSSSVDTRVVVLDTSEPVVSIITPSLLSSSYISTMKNDWELKDASVISKLVNGSFEVSGTIAEDSNIKSLTVSLKNEDGSITYYVKTLSDSENLRNWSFTVSSTDFNTSTYPVLASGKTILMIYTESTDEANNIEKKSQGYLCWWPESDSPWSVIPFGYDSIESATATNANTVYPGYTLQGQAYDDDGLNSVTAKIYKYNAGSEDTLFATNIIDLTSTTPTYSAWSIASPSGDSANGIFYIVVTSEDIYNTSTTSSKKYFVIQDINAPILNITSPSSDSCILGDSYGNITFTGTLNDDGNEATLKVVRIDMSSTDAISQEVKFLDSSYDGWSDTNTVSSTICSEAAKAYKISIGTGNTANDRTTWNFTQTMNIFTNFGIDGSSKYTNNQLFILWTSDGTSSRTSTVALTSDTDTPTLEIKKLTVTHSNSTINEYDFSDGSISNALPAFESGDKVILSGNWSDNSTTLWTDKTKISDITITWENAPTFTVTRSADGTWSTSPFTPPSNSTALITASITDWNKNTASTTGSFYIDTNEAKLVRISSTSATGSYNAGSVIYITTEFNKNITLSIGSSSPTLTLNNGATATYESGSGTTKHLYKYTVASSNTNTESLNVTTLTANGSTWKDSTNVILDMTSTGISSVLSSSNLSNNRTIAIDTKSPTVTISSSTATGNYNKEKAIYITATFNEDVVISDVSALTLSLNSGTNVKSDSSPVSTSSKTVLFTYTIQESQNANPLKVTGLNLNSATVKDNAGNLFNGSSSTTTLTGIIIDTSVPSVPTISGISSGTTSYTSQNFTISNTELGAAVEYSTDGGSSWITYSSSVTLSANGTYNVTARQTDAAGNISDSTSIISVTLDMGYLIDSISAKQANGTYTTGNTINILVTMRKAITVSSANMKVSLDSTSVSGTKEQSTKYNSSASTSTILQFDYTIIEGDNAIDLGISSLSISAKDSNSTDVSSFIELDKVSTGNTFIDNRSIEVVTGKPSIKNMEITGTDDDCVLTITFDRNISKNSGSISIVQSTTGYRAPAVLSSSKYSELLASIPSLSTYYTKGTNGADSTFASDLTTKYILNYNTNSDDPTLTGLFTIDLGKAAALTVTIPVVSSNVTIIGAVMTVAFNNGYDLPVKGATYSCTIPASFVVDSQSHANAEDTTTGASLVSPGVEDSVIRVNKENESITVSGTEATAIQPFTTEFKVDCQTPGATISASYTTKTSSVRTINSYYIPTESNGTFRVMDSIDTYYDARGTSTVSASGTGGTVGSSTNATITGTLGSSYSSDYTTGLTCSIKATSSYTVSSVNYTGNSYEKACRTIVQLSYAKDSLPTINSTKCSNMWLRGGDASSGAVVTSGLPFSWEPSETENVRCMTYSTDLSTCYWITWNLSTKAYIGFLAGYADLKSTTEGPAAYCWASCAWVSSKDYYPMLPGGSLKMESGWSVIQGQTKGAFGFQTKHNAIVRL